MTMLGALACIALFFAGHVVRDGWPSFKRILAGVVGTRFEWLYHLSTQFARLSGAAVCGAGAAIAGGMAFGSIVGAAVLAGFYLDMKHGEGAGVDTPIAIFDSFLSGFTSLFPLAVVLAACLSPLLGLTAVVVALLKPGVWKLAWLTCSSSADTWFQPTRVAAGTFGALIGAAVVVASLFLSKG